MNNMQKIRKTDIFLISLILIITTIDFCLLFSQSINSQRNNQEEIIYKSPNYQIREYLVIIVGLISLVSMIWIIIQYKNDSDTSIVYN